MAVKYIFIQNDPFYLPQVLETVLGEYARTTAGVNIQSVGQGGRGLARTAWELYRIYGFRYFCWKLTAYAWRKLCGVVVNDLLGRPSPCYSVRAVARKFGVPTTEAVDVNSDEFKRELRDLGVELIVSISGTQFYRKPLREQTPLGIVNCHGALLPKYRGLMPSFWTLLNGERHGGVTVHYVDHKLDNGPILVQKSYEISPDETLEGVMAKSKKIAAQAILEAIALIEKGNPPLITNDATQATHFTMPTPEDGRRFRASGRRFV